MKKENLKDNIVDAPTLFVGVGGTGCGIVRMVSEMCSENEVENIKFVCLDTNVNDLSKVENGKKKIFTIQTSTTQTVGDYLDYDKDALQNWFPKNAVMYDKTVSEGAGQVRAISRLALNSTIKTGRIRPLFDAIDELFRKDGRKMKQSMRVCMVSTASGGTGSGMILPLSMYIRDYVKNKYPLSGVIVRAMVLLPETLDSVISSEVERESQRRNAYATVKELNAFMMKGSGFCDIADGPLARYKDLHVDVPVIGSDEQKALALLPCDFCFLFDGQNAEDNTLVSLEQYKVQAAQALYEQNIGPMMGNAFSVEDNIIKELSKPENQGRNRFGGIGASVLRYPYLKVTEYIGCGWAMESIGGAGIASKWSKYDQEFKIKEAEAKKKGLVGNDAPKREVVYCDSLNNANDTFSKELRDTFLRDADDRLEAYYEALKEYMHESVEQNSAISSALESVADLIVAPDFEHNEKARKNVRNYVNNLRNYELKVNENAKKTAEGIAEALFANDIPTLNAREPYMLEFLLKNVYGDVCHPNAIRYLLYKVKTAFAEQLQTVANDLRDKKDELSNFSPNAHQRSMYDVRKTKDVEDSLDKLVNACGNGAKYDAEKHGKLKELIPSYFMAIKNYCELIAEQEAYKQGFEFVSEACTAFQQFYATFEDKVSALERRRDEIVDELKFTKGDSVLNVCSSKEMLEELALTTKNQSAEGAMLSSELNAEIFDSVKKNIKFERSIRNADIVEDDERIDIFDKIIIKFFVEKVRTECTSTDLNIIKAIAMENRLLARMKLREEQAESGGNEKIFDKVTHADNENYIRKIIERAKLLAAPGIQGVQNEEPRKIECCAYNAVLKDMRDYRVNDLLSAFPSKSAVDTISQYELHCFIAMYNITPNKLKKFSSGGVSETGKKDAGLYHNAYVEYAKNIGPDSTKDAMISTHIDKRWDSIAVLPEMDFDFQMRQMMRIHQAMIYGLVHRAITSRRISPVAGENQRVYRYENSDERYVSLTVSNGTLCDEFYEILDSLYISSSIVGDIERVRAKKCAKDKVRNANYRDTAFAIDVKDFQIQPVIKRGDQYKIGHDGVASLFEIPLYYYNSLPNSRRFTDEITALVDAVIKTFNDEIHAWEKGDDARFFFCDELYRQFMLMMDNYNKFDNLKVNTDACDNPVLDIIYRKIKNALSCDPEPDGLENMLEQMKDKIR